MQAIGLTVIIIAAAGFHSMAGSSTIQVRLAPGPGQIENRGISQEIGSSGWTRTSNPPVNSCRPRKRTKCYGNP